MELYCTFESDSEELTGIWEQGTALFSETETPSCEQLLAEPAAFPAYVGVALLLCGDASRVRTLLSEMGDYLTENIRGQATLRAACTYPLALSYYLRYTGDTAFVMNAIGKYCVTLSPYWDAPETGEDFLTSAFLLGAMLAYRRVGAACGMTLPLARQARLLDSFHSRFYDPKTSRYVDEHGESGPLTAVLPAALGFVSEGSHAAIRQCLIEDGFAVPRSYRMFLYDAMAAEELQDLLYPTVLEAGRPRPVGGYAELGALRFLLDTLCGVDTEMLGRGIRCMDPALPSYVSFRLTLPSGSTFLTYEGGDA